MLLIFPIIFVLSFFLAFKEVLNGNRAGVLLFIIFGLPLYFTAMSVSFIFGLKSFIPLFQFFKELIILSVLALNIANLKTRPKFHLVDYCILAFLCYGILYVILPIGDQTISTKLLALKSNAFFVVVYFAGRFTDIKNIYVNKYFSYVVVLTIGVGVINFLEAYFNQHLQTLTGYSEYTYYFLNFEPSGSYGLSTTFESEGGYKRFASIFATPLEHANATWIALAIIIALFTLENNRFKFTPVSIIGLSASLISITFALSRAPLISYFLIIYVYALLTRKKIITNTVHTGIAIGCIYLLYLFSQFDANNRSGILEIVMNTIDFSNPSSVGHLIQWVDGIAAIMQHPLGLGLGSSGRVAASVSENIGGENQYIIIGVQAGIFALLLYLSIYILLLKISLKWLVHLKGKERKICMAVLLIKIGLFIPLITSEVESSPYISYLNWFLSGLLISIVMKYAVPQINLATNA
jgi:hypothetical protein